MKRDTHESHAERSAGFNQAYKESCLKAKVEELKGFLQENCIFDTRSYVSRKDLSDAFYTKRVERSFILNDDLSEFTSCSIT